MQIKLFIIPLMLVFLAAGGYSQEVLQWHGTNSTGKISMEGPDQKGMDPELFGNPQYPYHR